MPPCQDETLKQSFLTSVLMLVGAISHNEGAHSYEFPQISELLECLMVSQGPEAEEGDSWEGGDSCLRPAACTRGRC